MSSSHVPLVYWWWPAVAKMWSILVTMQDGCPLWSASCSVLLKTLITSTIWWFCTQSAGVRPSASHLKISSNLSSNTATTGLCFWLLSSYQPLSPWRPSYHHTAPQCRHVSWCADRWLHWSGGEHKLPCCGWIPSNCPESSMMLPINPR